MADRLEEYRKLVYDTVKDITHIGTEISDDERFPHINIKIVFGGETIRIPISVGDIETNLHNGSKFVAMIAGPLEKILTPR